LAHDGVSWNTAYSSIQDALAVAAKGDEIWVAKGIYYPDIGLGQTKGDRKASFRLLDGVALYGGFAGTEKHRNERDWAVNVTVLSGDIDTNDGANSSGIVTDAAGINGDNSYSVVTAQNVSKAARLDGFVITAGQATGKEFPLFRGGGMVVYDHSSPTIANVTFRALVTS